MGKTKTGRQDSLSVSIYRKKDNKAGLVFAKRSILYRITSVKGYFKLMADLKVCTEVHSPRAIQLQSPRGRNWVLEIVAGAEGMKTALVVWELLTGGTAVPRFMWEGDVEELLRPLIKASLSVDSRLEKNINEPSKIKNDGIFNRRYLLRHDRKNRKQCGPQSARQKRSDNAPRQGHQDLF